MNDMGRGIPRWPKNFNWFVFFLKEYELTFCCIFLKKPGNYSWKRQKSGKEAQRSEFQRILTK